MGDTPMTLGTSSHVAQPLDIRFSHHQWVPHKSQVPSGVRDDENMSIGQVVAHQGVGTETAGTTGLVGCLIRNKNQELCMSYRIYMCIYVTPPNLV